MKFRIYPKKSVVNSQLQDRMSVLVDAYSAAVARDTALCESVLFVPQAERVEAARALKASQDAVREFQLVLDLFQSHGAEEIAVEYEG